jgi:hypothetical protein
VAGPGAVGFEELKGFVEGASAEEMLEPRGQGAAAGLVPGGDFLRHGLQCLQVRGGIAVAEGVVGDGFLATAEQGGEVRVEHGGIMGWAAAAGNPRGGP